jgi:RNA polymerase sigma factor (sigma-70 family)
VKHPLESCREAESPLEGGGPDERASHVARLFRQHNRMLVGLLVGRLRNEQEAKEVAQEAYVRVLQLEPRHGAVSYLRSYLFRVAENLAVDRLRQRRSRSRLDGLDSIDDFFEEPRGERAAIAEQELALLRLAVSELPARCREAFRLHKLEDLPFDEVAARMGVTERMVRKFVSRALVYIRLRREGHSEERSRELLKQ